MARFCPTHLRRRYAIKLLLPEAAKKPDLVLRFEREAIAGAHVAHPNVVGAVDFGKLPDGSCFLVQEFVEGTPLEELLKYGPLAVEKSLGFSRQIAQALTAVHEKGILHRDVKPRNILVIRSLDERCGVGRFGYFISSHADLRGLESCGADDGDLDASGRIGQRHASVANRDGIAPNAVP